MRIFWFKIYSLFRNYVNLHDCKVKDLRILKYLYLALCIVRIVGPNTKQFQRHIIIT
jgi:hypothetical protein